MATVPKHKKDIPTEEDAVIEPAPVEQPPLDAVIVIREVNENGDITPRLMLNGNVTLDQVDTLLRLALKGWQTKLGLD